MHDVALLAAAELDADRVDQDQPVELSGPQTATSAAIQPPNEKPIIVTRSAVIASSTSR